MIANETNECRDINEYLWRNETDYTTVPSIKIVFGIAYFVVISFATIGNLFVIFAFCRHKSLQSVRNTFIVSLGCSDIGKQSDISIFTCILIISVFVVSIVSGTVTPITAFSKIWLFGKDFCQIVPLIQVCNSHHLFVFQVQLFNVLAN